MHTRSVGWMLAAVALLGACATTPRASTSKKVTVGAASNLTQVFSEIGPAFTARTGVEVVFSYGSTSQLAQQIENGAPFDLFAAADIQHVDSLVSGNKLVAESRTVYALGQLAIWSPNGPENGIRELKDLNRKEVRFIAIAQPELAPYGQAAIEVLKHTGLWESLRPKLVYGSSISQAKQLASSGNADAAFTAYSLVLHERGTVIKVDPNMYRPIEQALGIVAGSPRIEEAKRFRSFLLGPEGRATLARSGYLLP